VVGGKGRNKKTTYGDGGKISERGSRFQGKRLLAGGSWGEPAKEKLAIGLEIRGFSRGLVTQKGRGEVSHVAGERGPKLSHREASRPR